MQKNNKVTNLSDSEFLSYLYSERDREENLNSYQGWSAWAVIGALITVICAGYTIAANKGDEINILRVGYILSSIAGLCICFRPYFLILKLIFSKERGCDVKRIKYLEDVCPKLYLWFTFLISVAFSIFIPINDSTSPWSAVSVGWIITAILLVFAIVYVQIKKDKIVWSLVDGLIFGELKLDRWFGCILGGVLSIIWTQSFKKFEGGVIGNPDVEMAVIIVTAIGLIYLLINILKSENMSSHMDVLLDDYIYKCRDKGDIYHQIQVLHMGYGVLEVCSREVYQLKNSLKDFEPQKKKVEEFIKLLSNGKFDINDIDSYINVMRSAFSFINQLKVQSEALERKIKQIENQVPRIEEVEEYRELLIIVEKLLEQENNVIKTIHSTVDQMDDWLNKQQAETTDGAKLEFFKTEQRSYGDVERRMAD